MIFPAAQPAINPTMITQSIQLMFVPPE